MNITCLFTLVIAVSVLAVVAYFLQGLIGNMVIVRDFFVLMKVSGIQFRDLPYIGSDGLLMEMNRRITTEAALLCRRGEQIAVQAVTEYPDDRDARLMRRKLAHMKDRSDLLMKYHRLPYVSYDWELDDPEWNTKAAEFKREWEAIERAFDILRECT